MNCSYVTRNIFGIVSRDFGFRLTLEADRLFDDTADSKFDFFFFDSFCGSRGDSI